MCVCVNVCACVCVHVCVCEIGLSLIRMRWGVCAGRETHTCRYNSVWCAWGPRDHGECRMSLHGYLFMLSTLTMQQAGHRTKLPGTLVCYSNSGQERKRVLRQAATQPRPRPTRDPLKRRLRSVRWAWLSTPTPVREKDLPCAVKACCNRTGYCALRVCFGFTSRIIAP